VAHTVEIETSRGLARAYVSEPRQHAGLALILGHGAGGGIGGGDLQAAQLTALDLGAVCALIEQPYRVMGRRSPSPGPHLDQAWIEVVAALRQRLPAATRIVCGGRSSGARVACRTAAATDAVGVLCLAFPLQPPQRRGARNTPPSRLGELDTVAVPVLVVQGERDRFGMPTSTPGRTVAVVSGDHALRHDLPAVQAAVARWLTTLIAS
jgi:predicted alpha/beta-hydrolase family hydrolase